MWLAVIEIIGAIIAAIRGWGLLPFILLGASMLLGFFNGIGGRPDPIISSLQEPFDMIIAVVFIIMSIVGRKRNATEQTTTISQPIISGERVPCIYCSALILPTAKICRFCGTEQTTTISQRVPCKYCSELILPTAKICRFCGREQ